MAVLSEFVDEPSVPPPTSRGAQTASAPDPKIPRPPGERDNVSHAQPPQLPTAKGAAPSPEGGSAEEGLTEVDEEEEASLENLTTAELLAEVERLRRLTIELGSEQKGEPPRPAAAFFFFFSGVECLLGSSRPFASFARVRGAPECGGMIQGGGGICPPSFLREHHSLSPFPPLRPPQTARERKGERRSAQARGPSPRERVGRLPRAPVQHGPHRLRRW